MLHSPQSISFCLGYNLSTFFLCKNNSLIQAAKLLLSVFHTCLWLPQTFSCSSCSHTEKIILPRCSRKASCPF